MKPTIGFIGLGLMGKPMARNLLKAGFSVTVWNRTLSRAEELVREGAKLGADPAATAAQADVLITIVSDPPAVEKVLLGANGALAALRRGSVLIDSSTISPELARRTAAACEERGVDYLDAPVTGGTWGAEKGELVFMVGGKARRSRKCGPCSKPWARKYFTSGRTAQGRP